MEQEKIDPATLVPMDIFTDDAPLRVDIAYAGPESFCGIIYRRQARLWLHKDLAAVVVRAARTAHEKYNLRLVVYDGLRTMAAQALMGESDIVKAHPNWLAEESRVLSPPGAGGHPRGMAVDVSLETKAGKLLDMGTAFDELPLTGSGPDVNRAHRKFADLTDEVKENRRKLDEAMNGAAARLNLPLWPLPVEWWDYRFPKDLTDGYAPLDDPDLPPQMRMTALHMDKPGLPDFDAEHFEAMRKKILARI